jgi:transcriptional regulator with XRE-family HTH domain
MMMSQAATNSHELEAMDGIALNVSERLGKTLARYRRRAGLSQKRLGEMADYYPTGISLLERGKQSCGVEALAKLAAALEIGVEDLMEGIEWVPSDETGGHFEVKEFIQFEKELDELEDELRSRKDGVAVGPSP